MSTFASFEAVRSRALELSAAGDWEPLCDFLGERLAVARENPELAALRAEALLRSSRPREAQLWLESVLAHLELAGNRGALRRAWNLLGAACFELGDLDEAEAAFDRALALARSDGDDLLVARANNNLGAIANVRGQRTQALALYQLAIPAYQRLGSTAGLSQCYHNIAITYRDVGRLNEADDCERRAIEFARDAASEPLEAFARLGLAELILRRGDAALAEAAARNVAASFQALCDPIRQCDALRLAGEACLARRHPGEARRALEEALALARLHGAALNEAEALRARAELLASAGDAVGARADADAAIAIFRRLGAREEIAAVEEWLRARLSAAD